MNNFPQYKAAALEEWVSNWHISGMETCDL